MMYLTISATLYLLFQLLDWHISQIAQKLTCRGIISRGSNFYVCFGSVAFDTKDFQKRGNVYLGYSPEFYLPVHSKGKFCTRGLNRNVQLSMGSYEVKRLKTIHITLSLIICFIVSGQLCSARQKIMLLYSTVSGHMHEPMDTCFAMDTLSSISQAGVDKPMKQMAFY